MIYYLHVAIIFVTLINCLVAAMFCARAGK